MNVIDWLLDSDPAIRWQVMRDLTDAPAEDVAAERARVAREGWGAAVLAAQRADGSWAGGAYAPEWTSTTSSLQLLRAFGVDPTEESVRRALALVRANVKWEYDDLPYFDGEVEPCINGQAVAIGAYFGQDVRVIVDRLLSEQMADGGWNCEQEPSEAARRAGRSTRRSTSSRDCWNTSARLAATRTSPRPASAGRSTCSNAGSCAGCPTARSAIASGFTSRFPTGWHYNALRGLDHLRDAGVEPDERVAEAIELVESKRDADGRWPLALVLHDELPVDLGEREGEPSRWITLRALRVLRWAGRSQPALSSSAASA